MVWNGVDWNEKLLQKDPWGISTLQIHHLSQTLFQILIPDGVWVSSFLFLYLFSFFWLAVSVSRSNHLDTSNNLGTLRSCLWFLWWFKVKQVCPYLDQETSLQYWIMNQMMARNKKRKKNTSPSIELITEARACIERKDSCWLLIIRPRLRQSSVICAFSMWNHWISDLINIRNYSSSVHHSYTFYSFILQANGVSSHKALSMFEEQLEAIDPPVKFTKCSAYVPSFMEPWVFYQVWYKHSPPVVLPGTLQSSFLSWFWHSHLCHCFPFAQSRIPMKDLILCCLMSSH